MTFDLFISHILYRNDDDDFDLFDCPVKHCVGGEEQSYRLIPLQIVAATTFIGHSLNRDGFVDDKSVIPMILLKGVELQRGFLRINSQSPSHTEELRTSHNIYMRLLSPSARVFLQRIVPEFSDRKN